MKLFTRYNRINLFSTLLIFLLASAAFYFSLRFILIDLVDDNLKIEQHEIETYIARHDALPEVMAVKDQQIHFTPAEKGSRKPLFSMIKVYDALEKEQDNWRQLVFSDSARGQWYRITVGKSMEETDNITRSVILITVITILLILVSSLIINRIVLRRLWQPFYQSLTAMREFRIGQQASIDFPATNTDEFVLMNRTLQQVTGKATHDYLLLKEFTENASHELQTPLAIIRSKLDLLIQDEKVSAGHASTLDGAYKAVQRLSRLNQSLLLLAKIENRQFFGTSVIDFKQRIEEKLDQFHELWETKQLFIEQQLQEIQITMNSELADILLNNTISNGIRHTPAGGNIIVVLDKTAFKIGNTASGERLPDNRLFSRFYTASSHEESHGLGLSIIKRICEVSGYDINYNYQDGMHWFIIHFKQEDLK